MSGKFLKIIDSNDIFIKELETRAVNDIINNKKEKCTKRASKSHRKTKSSKEHSKNDPTDCVSMLCNILVNFVHSLISFICSNQAFFVELFDTCIYVFCKITEKFVSFFCCNKCDHECKIPSSSHTTATSSVYDAYSDFLTSVDESYEINLRIVKDRFK